VLFNTSPEKFWNLIAKKYAADPIADRQAYEIKIDKLKTWMKSEMTVLDIGCATGTQCGDIADSVHKVTGIDISSKLLAIAQQRIDERDIRNVEFIETSAFDEQFEPGSFDVVMTFHVLHFFENLDVIVKRIHDLLKPGGVFISETGCLADRSKFLVNTLKIMGAAGLLPRITMLKDQQLQESLQQNGFTIVDRTKYSQQPDNEFTYVAIKS